MIPNIFHFIFGMMPDFGGKPFSLPHYLAIKSAIEVNQPEKVYFHYQYEPGGEWWERIKPSLILNQIEAPKEIFGNKLYHVAHQTDVVRLQMLKEFGGVYLDLDTISVKPLNELYNHGFVIGQELKPVFSYTRLEKLSHHLTLGNYQRVAGLCNGVLLSAPGSDFVNIWLDSFKGFRSKGMDEYWGEFAVEIPLKLAKMHPEKVEILSPYAFHYPLWDADGLAKIFAQSNKYPEAYVHHVWESHSWEKYLKHLTEENIKNVDTTYNCLARRYLTN